MEILNGVCHDGGGVSRAINVFWKNDFFENNLESFPDYENFPLGELQGQGWLVCCAMPRI